MAIGGVEKYLMHDLHWTKHAKEKMRFYGVSETRVKRIIENPERREEGIADKTIACMQTVGNKRKTEIWVMYVESPAEGEARWGRRKSIKSIKSKKVVSVWRYPGQTKPRDPVPIPREILTTINTTS